MDRPAEPPPMTTILCERDEGADGLVDASRFVVGNSVVKVVKGLVAHLTEIIINEIV